LRIKNTGEISGLNAWSKMTGFDRSLN
jgi:hypothetical protein